MQTAGDSCQIQNAKQINYGNNFSEDSQANSFCSRFSNNSSRPHVSHHAREADPIRRVASPAGNAARRIHTHTGGRAATSHTFDLQHRPLCCHCLSHSIAFLFWATFWVWGAARTALPQPAAATTVALPSGMACRELNDALNEDADAARALSPHENGQDRSTKDHRLRTAFEEVPL